MNKSQIALVRGGILLTFALILPLCFFLPSGAHGNNDTVTNEALAQRSNSTDPDGLLASGRVLVRLRIDPDDGKDLVVGQQTRILIEVLSDSRFSQAPQYPELTIAGAITLMPEQMGTNFTETIRGTSFVGQRRGYVLFPQRAGLFKIPSLEIPVGIAGVDGSESKLVLRTSPIPLSIRPRSGVNEAQGLITTPQLVIEDEWDRPFDALEVGQAIQRSIRIQATESLGMLLPQLSFNAPPGIAVYPDPPRIRDRINRGQYRGERSQTITYVLQERGNFDIPPIEVQWWSPETGALQSKVLASQSFDVHERGFGASNLSTWAAGIASWRESFLSTAKESVRWLLAHWIGGVLCVCGVVIAWRAGPRITKRLKSDLLNAYARRRNSEPYSFKSLERSLQRGEVNEIARRYWIWRGHLTTAEIARAAHTRAADQGWPQAMDADRSIPQWRVFQESRYGRRENRPEELDLSRLRHELRAFRARWRKQQKQAAKQRRAEAIAPQQLNPHT